MRNGSSRKLWIRTEEWQSGTPPPPFKNPGDAPEMTFLILSIFSVLARPKRQGGFSVRPVVFLQCPVVFCDPVHCLNEDLR